MRVINAIISTCLLFFSAGSKVVANVPVYGSSDAEVITGTGMVKIKSAFRYAPVSKNPPPHRLSPPQKYPPPRSASVNSLANYTHLLEYNELQIVCPQIIDPVTSYTVSDPNCQIPVSTVAVGEEAIQVRDNYQLMNGDIVNITIEESNSTNASRINRRQLLHQTRIHMNAFLNMTQTLLQDLQHIPAAIPQKTFSLLSLKPIRLGSQKEIFVGEPITLYTIVFIMDFSDCKLAGWAAPSTLTKDRVTKDILGLVGSPANNLANYYKTCSYGKTVFTSNNSIVVGPVPIKCIGGVLPPLRPPRPPPPPPRSTTYTSLSRKNATYDDWWDLSKYCTASEQQAWERAAEAYAQAQVAQNPQDPEMMKLQRILLWRSRRRNIYILPPSVKCAWAGYGDVTCTSATCSAYIRGYSTNALQVIMHESMHNYGLEHAGKGVLEYGDQNDVMGDFNKAGSGLLCPNAPNQYRIGWSKPINEPGTPPFKLDSTGAWGNLTAANFSGSANVIRGLVLPAQGTRDDNMIVINLGPHTLIYYLSYRVRNKTAGGYDSSILSTFSNKVLVHSYNGIPSERVFGFKSNLLDWGPKFTVSGNNWWLSHNAQSFKTPDINGFGGAVKITVIDTNGANAVVDICRISEWQETSCSDGIDNDCNGLADDEDPGCA